MSDTYKMIKEILNNQEKFSMLQEKIQEDINLIKIQQKEHEQLLFSLKTTPKSHNPYSNFTHKNHLYSINPNQF